MRRIHRSALAALPIAFAALSIAPPAGANDVPKYSDIPTGRVTITPKAKAPGFIGGRERVPGFFVAMPKFGPEIPASGRHVSVVGDQKSADSIRKGDGSGDDDRELSTCFSESQGSSSDDEDPEAREWSSGQMREVNLWPRSKENETAGVGAVHSERVVQANGRTTLESVDAWVDPVTQGARVIARASLPLVQVGSAIGGVKVYAGRDERDGATRFMQFVVVRPSTSAVGRAGAMMAMRQDGLTAHGSGCGHLRVALLIDPKNGDSSVVVVPVEIASVDPTAKARADADAKAAPAEPAPSVGIKGKRFRMKRRPPPPPPTPTPTTSVEREVRTRDVQLHLSVSQTSRDKEPLVAVSFGWAGRETLQRVMDEVPAALAPTE
jgi:hypothetical protein